MPYSTVALLLLLSVPNQLPATCRPIDRPDEVYRAATTVCFLGPLLKDTRSCSVANTGEVANFDIPLSVRTCFDCWGRPPESEGSPGSFFGFTGDQGTRLTVSLHDFASIAGMEIEQNFLVGSFPIVASFRAHNGEELLRIERILSGRASARLFAVGCDGPVIDSVLIEAPPEALGFAIAFVRSDAFIHSLLK